MTRPLHGIRVVDLSNTLPDAQTSQFLADYGPEVVHVEPPGGSRLGREPAWPAWARASGASSSTCTRAPTATLLSTSPRTRTSSSRRSGREWSSGSGSAATTSRRATSGWCTCRSRAGPARSYARIKGYEALAKAKVGAFHSFRQMVPRPGPAFASVPYCSYSAAQTALHAILAALYERERSGLGQRVDATLVQGLAALDTWGWFLYLVGLRFPDAFEPQESVSDDRIPNTSFVYRLLVAPTAGNRWLQFSQVQPHLFEAFMRALGLEALFDDPEWAGVPEFDDPERRSAFWGAHAARGGLQVVRGMAEGVR
jgi:crotonobetainyl-CoA:carnitine CoA-transferase CaiB-like acyl-CoA transferase